MPQRHAVQLRRGLHLLHTVHVIHHHLPTPPLTLPLSDWSFSSAATAADTLPHARASPFLLSLTATGATISAAAEGYTLCPSAATVTLTYATQTCEQFYKQRSSSWPHDCDAKQPLLSSIVTGACA